MKTVSAIIVFLIVTTLTVSGQQWTTTGTNISNTNTGNVGINTTTPQSKLHIAGDGRALGPVITVQNGIGIGLVGGLHFASGIGSYNLWSDLEAYATGGTDQQDLRFYTTYGVRNERMRIDQWGNVGIGTAAPTTGYKLDVSGNLRIQSKLSIGNDLWHESNDGAARVYYGTNDRTYFGSRNGYEFRSNADLSLSVLTNAGDLGIGITPLAKLDVNGNVYCRNIMYIGTPDATTPSQISGYALAVNGTAIFNKAKVKLYGNWPDYVFDDKYNLLPLPEVEKFLKINKHLPDVPSAAEIAKDGIDLGDNQSKLLKKIEELTLYMIEQNKKMEAQSAEISSLQKQINGLQKNQ